MQFKDHNGNITHSKDGLTFTAHAPPLTIQELETRHAVQMLQLQQDVQALAAELGVGEDIAEPYLADAVDEAKCKAVEAREEEIQTDLIDGTYFRDVLEDSAVTLCAKALLNGNWLDEETKAAAFLHLSETVDFEKFDPAQLEELLAKVLEAMEAA
jgi:hypothetical protein